MPGFSGFFLCLTFVLSSYNVFMQQLLKTYWEEKPYQAILLLAILLRLVASIFSRGYGMHDDHFLVIETAQSWLDNANYNNWFLEREKTDIPTILNFIYAGLHYLLFSFLESIGVNSPQSKMFIVRLIHGIFSLLIVVFGYKITERLSDRNTAKITGLLLAAYWFIPFFSVRALVEMVCIPFIMWGYWILLKHDENNTRLREYLLAGILFGIAFSLRFQTIIISGGIGLIFLFRKKWLETIMLGIGISIPVILIHGLADFIIWGYPFAEILEYINHNVHHRFDYTISPWYSYLLVIAGVLIVPVSLFLVYGFMKTWKSQVIIFLPVLLFIIFHSYFPNKQERFILPIIPLFIMLGVIGWNEFRNRIKFSARQNILLRYCWVFFWTVNIILLSFFTVSYSKKARVESMVYLSGYDGIQTLLVEESNRDHATMMPLFYLHQWPTVINITKKSPATELPVQYTEKAGTAPDFFLFVDSKNLKKRVRDLQQYYPEMEFETSIEPGFMDKVLHWLNPVNANQTIIIYRNK